MRTNVTFDRTLENHDRVLQTWRPRRSLPSLRAISNSVAASPMSALGNNDGPVGGHAHLAREIFEPVLALIAIIITAPIMFLVALVVVMQDGGKPIFVQQRIGRGGIPFPCLKFRTMVVDAQVQLERLLASDPAAAREWAIDQKLRHDPRITPLGAWLRKTSLDELPQFFNILAGHMSLVGPRPIVDSEVSRYGRYFRHYISVRPGLTGLWQVSGRSNLTYRRRVVIDTVYVRTRTLTFDIAILLRTVPALLTRRGSV